LPTHGEVLKRLTAYGTRVFLAPSAIFVRFATCNVLRPPRLTFSGEELYPLQRVLVKPILTEEFHHTLLTFRGPRLSSMDWGKKNTAYCLLHTSYEQGAEKSPGSQVAQKRSDARRPKS
jgi:hypothetical protein